VAGRDVEEDSYQLAGFPCWQLEGGTLSAAAIAARTAAEREKIGERSAQILDLLMARGQMATKDVAEALGIPGDQASVYLGRLAGSERITKLGRGLWQSLVPPVGSVGSVGNIGQSQPTQQGIQEMGWETLARLAERGLRERGKDT
jgi:hypothetical protein